MVLTKFETFKPLEKFLNYLSQYEEIVEGGPIGSDHAFLRSIVKAITAQFQLHYQEKAAGYSNLHVLSHHRVSSRDSRP